MRADPKPRRRRRRLRLVRSATARLNRSVGTIRQAIAEPRSVPGRIRDAVLRLWRIRGGGFYGVGYVVTFLVLEAHAFVANWLEADDIVGVVVQEVASFVFRFAAQSFVNGFIAFGWPLFVLRYLGGIGLLVLGAAWWLFERHAKPWIVARLPEPGEVAPRADPPEPRDAH